VGQERIELTGQLREDIERTRSDLSWTIGEIEDRLRPERLMRQARERVSGAVVERMKHMMNSANETAGRVADRAQHSAETVAGRVRENPIPLAAVAAAGLAWWMARDRERGAGEVVQGEMIPARRSNHLMSMMGEHPVSTALLAGTVGYLLSNRTRRTDGYPHEVFGEPMEPPAQDLSQRAADRARQAGESVSTYAAEVKDAAAHRAVQVRSAVSEYSGHAREAIGGYVKDAQSTAAEATGRLREKARHLAGDVQHRLHDTGPAVERWIHDNPLALGAAALAVGAAVGLSAPRTRAENRTLGQTRDALMDKATTAVRDAGDKAKAVVHDVSEAARTAAAMSPSPSPSGPTVAPTNPQAAPPPGGSPA
jgi:hypothetical protein